MKFESLNKKKKIILVGKDLGDGDIDVLAKVLGSSDVVSELNLMCNNISLCNDDLTDAIASNKTLRILSLYNNKVGAEGAMRLAAALKTNDTLQQLFLEGNNIGDDGAKELASALKTNASLEVLILRDNSIGDDGARSLATAFLFNRGLRVVLLGENEIGNVGGQALAEALECNPRIDQLMLDGNKMSDILERKVESIVADPGRRCAGGENKTHMLPKRVVETLIVEKDDQIAAMAKEIAELRSYKSEVFALLKSNEELQGGIAARDADLASKKQELAASNDEISSLRALVESPLDLLAALIKSKDVEIESLKATVAGVSQSKEQVVEAAPSISAIGSDISDEKVVEDYSCEDDDHTNENYDSCVVGDGIQGILKNNLAILHEANKVVDHADADEPKLKSRLSGGKKMKTLAVVSATNE